MTQSEREERREIPSRRRIGKIVLAAGLLIIFVVIVLGMFVSLVSAYGDSTELLRVYDALVGPGLFIGILLMMIGFAAILLPEGFSQDGVWVLKTGPYVR
ncbi:MAG: hypothetical protein PVJ05_03220 [Candidatus Thorarchaeota archaeon]|jgi:hypothetical protein